jgi:hypothetical protein
MEHRYKVIYRIEPREVSKEEVPEGYGACDAVIVHSLLRPPDGSLSHMVLSLDGRTGKELSADELFEAWIAMSHALAQMTDLSAAKRKVALIPFTIVRGVIFSLG